MGFGGSRNSKFSGDVTILLLPSTIRVGLYERKVFPPILLILQLSYAVLFSRDYTTASAHRIVKSQHAFILWITFGDAVL